MFLLPQDEKEELAEMVLKSLCHLAQALGEGREKQAKLEMVDLVFALTRITNWRPCNENQNAFIQDCVNNVLERRCEAKELMLESLRELSEAQGYDDHHNQLVKEQ